jgi:hypothetical protein
MGFASEEHSGETPPILAPPQPNYNTGIVPPPVTVPTPYVPATAPTVAQPASSKLFGIVDTKVALIGGAAIAAYLIFKK